MYLEEKKGTNFSMDVNSPQFVVTVLPHRLSMAEIPQQLATAGKEFYYPLKSAVQYYDESQQANTKVNLDMAPNDLNELNKLGLFFDPVDFSIKGTPNRIGRFNFNVGARNQYSRAEATPLTIEVYRNASEKPVFKQNNSLASAMPTKKYSINLMSLLQENAEFMHNNQITFKFSNTHQRPEWLYISPENPTILQGIPPKYSAGQEVEATLIATSNTGGDSDPLTIKIPIAFDPEQQPLIELFELKQLAGDQLYADISSHINDPAKDPGLKVILDKVEPAASWLSISSSTPTVLEGVAPIEATGQSYQITLYANTSVGGNSKKITIPLQISIDKKQTPQFKSANPQLPMVYPGQKFFHDFVEHRDVSPEYEDTPYKIQFAEGSEHPEWLKLENNKLSADPVPEDLESDLSINLVIKNIPGGSSEVITLYLN